MPTDGLGGRQARGVGSTDMVGGDGGPQVGYSGGRSVRISVENQMGPIGTWFPCRPPGGEEAKEDPTHRSSGWGSTSWDSARARARAVFRWMGSAGLWLGAPHSGGGRDVLGVNLLEGQARRWHDGEEGYRVSGGRGAYGRRTIVRLRMFHLRRMGRGMDEDASTGACRQAEVG